MRRRTAAARVVGTIEQLERRTLLSASLVSVNAAGTAASGGEILSGATDTVFSPDGRHVLFRSDATDLVAGVSDGDGVPDLFVRDLQTQTTRIVSVNSAGEAVGADTLRRVRFTAGSDFLTFVSGEPNLDLNVTDTNGIDDLFVFDIATGVTKLLTAERTGQAAGYIDQPRDLTFSPDGRYIAFECAGKEMLFDVVDSNAETDLFLYDLSNDKLSMVTVDHTGTASGDGGAGGMSASFSPDGKQILFANSAKNLVAGIIDDNFSTDVFVRDLATGVTRLLSAKVGSNGGETANAGSLFPSFSPDGKSVLFESTATDLVGGMTDESATFDVFLSDVDGTVTALLSTQSDGLTAAGGTDARFSAAGGYVSFLSASENLAGGVIDGNDAFDLFVRDLQAGDTFAVSVDAAGNAIGVNSFDAPTAASAGYLGFSAGDSFALFRSSAANLVAGTIDSNGADDLFLIDLATRSHVLVTAGGGGVAGGVAPAVPVNPFSADGRYLAFVSSAADLVGSVADGNGSSDVFLRELTTGVTTLVSLSASGTSAGNAASLDPTFSPNGRVVLFRSAATDLVTGVADLNGGVDLFARNLDMNTTSLIGNTPAGVGAGGGSLGASGYRLTRDGARIAFASTSPDLGTGVADGNGISDVFVLPAPAGGFPEIEVFAGDGSGPEIVLGDAAPTAEKGTDFGIAPVGDPTPVVREFTVKNTGSSVLNVGHLALPAGYSLAAPLIASIEPGASSTFAIRFDAPASGLFAGDVTFTTNDTDETPFRFAISGSVDATIPDNLPTPLPIPTDGVDLAIIDGVSGLKSGNFVGGAKGGTARTAVQNLGNEMLNKGTIAVQFFASSDASVDDGDVPVGNPISKRLTLKPGSKPVKISAKFNYPVVPADGSYFILARVSSPQILVDINPANDAGASPEAIGIAAPFVEFTSVSLASRGKFTAGKSGTASYTIRNGGNIAAKSRVAVQLFATTDGAIGGDDDVVLFDGLVSVSLKPGTSRAVAIRGKLTNLVAGSYTLVANLVETGHSTVTVQPVTVT